MHLPADKAIEYILDRKNAELRELQEMVETLKKEKEQFTVYMLLAEIILFVLGIFAGMWLMKTYGWRPL